VLTAADRAGTAPVTVINETAARRFWPDANPIGKFVWLSTGPVFMDRARPVEVVGVVADVKYLSADQPIGPDFYTSYLQFAYPDSLFLVKAPGATPALAGALRAAIASVDATVPVFDVQMLDSRIDAAVSRPRYTTTLVGMAASAAVLLAALGVYGVLSFAVSTRRREIAIRLALGAIPGGIVRLVLRQGVGLAVTGAAAGLGAVLLTRRLLPALVADIPVPSFTLVAVVVALVLAVAAMAALLPARRAGRVDPLVVLRNE